MEKRIPVWLIAICCWLVSVVGCAGVSGPSAPPPHAAQQGAPQISVSQSSVSVSAGGTASFTVTVTGAPTPNLSCAVNGAGTVQLSGLLVIYGAPSTVPAGGQATIACTATNAAGSATVSVTARISSVPGTQAAPQITASQSSINVSAGGTASFTVTVTGVPTPNLSCAVNGAGTVQLSGLLVIYGAPSTVPAGGQATIACTATNTVGSATASVRAEILAVTPAYSGPVPESFFGLSLMDSSNWPLIPFGTLGKAPGVPWPYVEKTKGTFNWTQLDAFVAQANAHGVSFVYSSEYVPSWAAADRSSCHPYAYSTTVCTGTVVNIQDWKDFMTALVTRYKGRIQVYELWNEPSCLCTFTGTVAQLVALTNAEHDVIRSIDPAALIVGPTMQGYASAYLDSYFAAGGTKDIDAVGMHSSPNPNNDVAEFLMGSVTTDIKNVMKKYGLSSKPLWNTENDWGNNASLTDPNEQAAFVARDLLLNWNVGVARDYWYAWDNSTVGTLWSPTTGVTEAATAYEQVESWMKGATFVPCSLNGSTNSYHAVYTCNLTRSGGYQAQAVWYTDGNKTYTAPSQFTQYRDLSGGTSPIPTNHQVTIGHKPILLEAPAGTGTANPIVFQTASLPATTNGAALKVIDRTGTMLFATAVGNYVTYTVTVPKAGTYDVKVGVKETFNRGKWQLSINGINQGPVEDEYVPGGALAEFDLGVATISSSGPKSFKFLIVGKNAQSTGYSATFEYIKLTP
jgi:hypothetical protein